MPKKRKHTSTGASVQHLDTDHTSSSPSKHLNLSAYHPDLDLASFPASSQSLYRSLLPHSLVHPSAFPPKLLKYWRHRHSLFSLYSSGCLLDEQSWYSVTPESVAFRIAKRCATDGVIVDLFTGAGGNAIQFAMTCAKVIAVELDELKLNMAQWNAEVYGVKDRILFIHGDSLQLLDTLLTWRKQSPSISHQQDEQVWNGIKSSDLDAVHAVFLSPPWGGIDYAQPTTTDQNPDTTSTSTSYSLTSIQPVDGATLFSRVCQAFHTTNIAYYLPRNTSLQQLSHLALQLDRPCKLASSTTQNVNHNNNLKVEYQYVDHGRKLSSLTAYYGALATDWDDSTDDWRQT